MEMFFLFDLSLSLSFFLNLKTHIPLRQCLDFSECKRVVSARRHHSSLEQRPQTPPYTSLCVYKNSGNFMQERRCAGQKPKIKNKTKQQTRFTLE